MRKFILIFIFCYAGFANAQTPKIDSLNKLIANTHSDTARINLVNKKVNAFGNINLDSAINIGEINIANAQKINYQKGVADGISATSTSLLFKGEYAATADKLKTALKIYTQLNDSAGLSKIYSSYGMYYGMQSIYDTSIIYFKKTLSLSLLLHDKKMINTSYQNLATSYQMLSDYSNSLLYYQKALKSAEEDNNYVSQAYIYMNLGMAYASIEDTPRAEQSYLKSITLSKKTNLKNVELYAYSNIASLYSAMNKFNEAYSYAIKASELGKETGDVGMEASALSRAGNQLANMNKFPEAEALARKGMQLADSSKQPLNIYQTNSDYGLILKMQNRYSEAIPYYEKAFGVMKKSDIYDNQVGRSYADFSDCYEKTGDYQKALQTYKLSAQIEDSIRSKDNIRKATELALNYDFDKKQEVAKAEQQKKDEISKTKQTALILGLALMLILAGVSFYAFRNKRKANFLLQNQKTEIQSTLSELKNTQAQLIHSEKMASLGELTAGIAHEIQNPLNFVNNFSEVNNELIEELKNRNTQSKNSDVQKEDEILTDIFRNNEKIIFHGKRADAIVKGMLQHSRQTNGIKQPTDINALADEYLRLSYHGLRAKDKTFNANYKTDFDESLSAGEADTGKINIISQDIGRVLLNLYNNAFYAVNEKLKASGSTLAAHYKPLVSIQTKKINNNPNNDRIEIKVADNGNGIPKAIVDKIFQPFFTTKPTGEGTGLGLSLSYDIIKAHGGEIKVESREGEGTEFIIYLPA
jgi:two-component system NtrC family sensor kinase